MRESGRIEVTLSRESVEFVRSKISSGEFASESAVIQRGLEALRQESEELDKWEHEVLLPAHDRVISQSARLIGAAELERCLESKRRKRSSLR